ncbi:MAG: class I SAM-dependent methyltransferase [Methanobacteriota archaeon]
MVSDNERGFCSLNGQWGSGAKYENLLRKVMMYWPEGRPAPSNLLDVGCGTGGLLEACRKRGLVAYGIEGSKEIHDECVSKGLSVSLHNLEQKSMFDFENGSIDIVICSQIIEHLTPESGAHLVKESQRILSENGMLVIFSPSYYDKLNRTRPFHVHCYKPRELGEIILASGFEEAMHLSEAIPNTNWAPYREGEDSSQRKNRTPINLVLNLLLLVTGLERLDGTAHFVAYKRRVHQSDLPTRILQIRSILENLTLG